MEQNKLLLWDPALYLIDLYAIKRREKLIDPKEIVYCLFLCECISLLMVTVFYGLVDGEYEAARINVMRLINQ